MIRYVVRRVIFTIPVVFGISIVTFILVHLAPGTPGAARISTSPSSQGIDEEVMEFSRSYFLHLPLFLNFNIQDAKKDAKEIISALKNEMRRDWVRRQISYRGGAILPYIIPVLDSLSAQEQEVVINALEKVGDRMGLKDELSASKDKVAFWKSYWSYYNLDYKMSRARRLVDRFVSYHDDLAYKEIVRLDTFAFPAVFEALKKEEKSERLSPLLNFVLKSLGKEVPRDFFKDESKYSSLRKELLDWWSRYEDEFTTCDSLCKITGVVTKTRYFKWLQRLSRLNFGVSLRDGMEINEKIKRRLPVTLLLSFLALLFSYCVAIPLGIFSAFYANKPADKIITLLVFVLYSLPAFWTGVALIRLFCGTGLLDIFPLQGFSTPGIENLPFTSRLFDYAKHLTLPVITLSYVSLAAISRYQRAATLDVLKKEYIKVAMAKGLDGFSLIRRHVLKNSILPVITLIGLQIPFLIGGSVIVERIFGIEGMGLETFEAIRSRDYNWVLAVAFITSILTVIGMILADFLYAIVDPRIRREMVSENK